MKYETATYLIAFFGLVNAHPMPVPEPKNVWTISIPRAMLRGREVPQEHSHDRFLDGVRVNLALNNPNNIQDPVFGLLGNAAAAAGAGKITNLDCLHQATADQAFTNAKAAGNVTGQADALMYAALERNTGSVGLASAICTQTAVNPEIQAVQQHQDPASAGAAAGNKAVVLALAKQLASIGADPQEALLSGTFAPGTIGDPTAKGHTCDTQNDPQGGCIFSQNLLVDDATAAEITAAVAGIAAGSGTAASASAAPAASSAAPASAAASSPASAASAAGSAACSVTFVTQTAAAVVAAATSAASAPAASASPAAASTSTTASGSLNFGSCSNPAILFENGLDGRTQPAFIAANQADFPHGSALNIGVISSFICQRLSTSCAASAAANTACTAAEAAASAAGGTTQAAADAFNSALGVSGSSSTAAAASPSAASAAPAATSAAAAASPSAATPASAAAASTASTAATTSGNVQTFTGSLGGLPPPVIQSTGTRPFSVNGNTFVNKSAAIQRSCAIQNNACANAVNSKTLVGKTVADCNAQETACNAAGGA